MARKMKKFVGLDHGTGAVRFAIIGDGKAELFSIVRSNKRLSSNEVLGKLFARVRKEDIGMLCMTYSMGDAICEITHINDVPDRGVRSTSGVGEWTGTGTQVYDIIKKSGIPTILVPGMHSECDFLDRRFRTLYSHCGSPDKVCAAYHAFLKFSARNMIVASIGASAVSVAIKDGKIAGALDACILAPGMRYGPLDVDAIRKIDAKRTSANDAFSHAGMRRLGFDDVSSLVEGMDSGNARLALDSLILSTAMDVSALFPVFRGAPKLVVLTGSVPCALGERVFASQIRRMLPGTRVEILDNASAAVGASEIARDVYDGKRTILGIKVRA